MTSPQELVGMIVSKAVNMAKKMDVDIIGIVENMSYVKCPDCDKKIYMFGKSHSQEVADRYQLPLLGQLPIDSELTQLSDQGYVENYHSDWFDEFSQKVKDILKKHSRAFFNFSGFIIAIHEVFYGIV